MQYVEIELDPDEGVIAESGSFMMMDDGIKMETIFPIHVLGGDCRGMLLYAHAQK